MRTLSAAAALVQPAPPTSLVRDLHDYPRLDSRLKAANNTLPAFTGGEEEHRYLQGVWMAAVFPVALVLCYFLVEYAVRLVVACCTGCCNGKPSPARATRARPERLHKTRCWWAVAAVVAVFFATSAAYAVFSSAHAGDAASRVGDRGLTVADETRALEDSGDDLVSLTGQAASAAAGLLDPRFDAPEAVAEALRGIESSATQARGNVAAFLYDVRAVSPRHYVHEYREHSDHVYGAWSGMSWALALVSLVVAAYGVTAASCTRRSRSRCASASLVLFDVAASALLLALVAVAFVQLSALLVASDACVDPRGAADRAVAAHLDGTDLGVARYYLWCDPAHPNPLNSSLADADASLAEAAEADASVREWAAGKGGEAARLSYELTGAISGGSDALPALQDRLLCPVIHNALFEATNEACDPLVRNVFNLLTVQAAAALALLLFRAIAVYRCCRCCHETDAESGAEEWLLAPVSADGAVGGRGGVDYGATEAQH